MSREREEKKNDALDEVETGPLIRRSLHAGQQGVQSRPLEKWAGVGLATGGDITVGTDVDIGVALAESEQ